MTDKAHVVIVGGGLAGLLLGCVVATTCRDRLSVTLIERALPEAPEESLDDNEDNFDYTYNLN